MSRRRPPGCNGHRKATEWDRGDVTIFGRSGRTLSPAQRGEITESGPIPPEVDWWELRHYICRSCKDRCINWIGSDCTEVQEDPKIVDIERERWFKDLRSDDRSTVLRVDLERVDEVNTTAYEIRRIREAPGRAPGSFQLYNVDFSEEFRYYLETGTDPTPSSELSLLEFSIEEKPLADQDITALRTEGEPVGETPRAVLEGVVDELDRIDPDVLLVNTAQIVPLLYDAADDRGAGWFDLGRLPGYKQLASVSTFESYGVRGHSPARYNIPGRVIIDQMNSFLWNKAGFQGLLDLTERSWKPSRNRAGPASVTC